MKKKFDAVKFQRKVREELSKKYNVDREAFLRELKEKYGLRAFSSPLRSISLSFRRL